MIYIGNKEENNNLNKKEKEIECIENKEEKINSSNKEIEYNDNKEEKNIKEDIRNNSKNKDDKDEDEEENLILLVYKLKY